MGTPESFLVHMKEQQKKTPHSVEMKGWNIHMSTHTQRERIHLIDQIGKGKSET